MPSLRNHILSRSRSPVTHDQQQPVHEEAAVEGGGEQCQCGYEAMQGVGHSHWEEQSVDRRDLAGGGKLHTGRCEERLILAER